MEESILTAAMIRSFYQSLTDEEKSAATVEKYIRDVCALKEYLSGRPITKEKVMAYKESLIKRDYAVRSINSMVASINSFLRHIGLGRCRVKSIRIQRQIYSEESRVLTKGEYLKLVQAAQNNPRLQLIMQSICATGIRVSELKYFTVEAAEKGEVTIHLKGKLRRILIPRKLQKMLLGYARRNCIKTGSIFVTRGGRHIHRSTIWAQMKALCKQAGVNAKKGVSP